MSKPLTFWLIAVAVALLLFWYLQDILLPFIAGTVAAYFLDPLADRLERLGLPRVLACTVIILTAILAVVVALLVVLPPLANQIGKLVSDLPSLSQQLITLGNSWAPDWLKDFLANNGGDLQSTLKDYAGKAALWLASLGSTLLSGSQALLNLLSLCIITPVVAFYLLVDWDRLVAKVDAWLPRENLTGLRGIARDTDRALAGYIRGQSMVCLVLAVLYSAGFMLVGLKSGLAIGVMTGLLTFIPFFGAALGGVTAVVVGLVQFWPNELSLLGVIAVLAVGQLVENYYLSPKLVGESIGLHPVWMMLALFAFAYVFGILGLLLAVPLAATTGVLVRHGLARYLASDIYLGGAKKNGRRA